MVKKTHKNVDNFLSLYFWVDHSAVGFSVWKKISFIELTTDWHRVPMEIPEIGKDPEFCNYEVNDKVPSLRRFIGKFAI